MDNWMNVKNEKQNFAEVKKLSQNNYPDEISNATIQ